MGDIDRDCYSMSVASKWVWSMEHTRRVSRGRILYLVGGKGSGQEVDTLRPTLLHAPLAFITTDSGQLSTECKTARVGSPWTPGWKTGWNTDKILGKRCYQMHVPVPDAVWKPDKLKHHRLKQRKVYCRAMRETGDSSPCSKPQTPQRFQ